jgi:methionyl-tRNA formyltransferase
LSRLLGRQQRVPSLRQMQRKYGISIVGSKDVNSAETLAQIREWRPDLVISIYLNQLIKRDLIAVPTQGCLNVHPALLPRNRGLFPYFWVFANGDKETGVTLHWVDECFDTGKILLQEVIPVEPGDTITSLSYKSAVVGADMLTRGVAAIAAGNPPHIEQDSTLATYHSWPSVSDQKRFRRQGGGYGTIFDLMKYM